MNKNINNLCVYHQEPAIVICTNEACNDKKYCCLACMQNQHADHINLCINLDQYHDRGDFILRDAINQINTLRNQVEYIHQITQHKQKIINENQIIYLMNQAKNKSIEIENTFKEIIKICNENQDKQELAETIFSNFEMTQNLKLPYIVQKSTLCAKCETSQSSILLLKCGHQFCSKCVKQNKNQCCYCQGSIIEFGHTMTQCRVCQQYHPKDETGLVPIGFCRACALKQKIPSDNEILKTPQLEFKTTQNKLKYQGIKQKSQIRLNQSRKVFQRQLSFKICDLCSLNCEKLDLFQNSTCGHYYCFACSHLANMQNEYLEICLVKDCNCLLNMLQFDTYYYEKQNLLLESLINEKN